MQRLLSTGTLLHPRNCCGSTKVSSLSITSSQATFRMVLEALPPPASTLRSDFTILEDNASVHYLNNTAKALANQQPPLAESPFHNKKSNIIDIDSYPKPFSAEDQENRVVTASSPQYAESPKTTRRIVANTSSRSPTSDQDISKVKQVVRQKRRPVLLSPNHCRPNTPSLGRLVCCHSLIVV